MEVYKIMRGTDEEGCQSPFPGVEISNTRGHRFKVKGDLRGDCVLFYTHGD